ncbi:MAG: hypothetical protein NTY35_08625 [Planctomycetota bacterium]|nr:hypothetical protein [Planctomycetota bacterium]
MHPALLRAALAVALLVQVLPAQSIVSTQPAGPNAPSVRRIAGLTRLDLAGRSLAVSPQFEFVQSFFEGDELAAALDTNAHPEWVGVSANVYVCEHKDEIGWAMSPALVDVRGSFQTVAFVAGGVPSNRITLDSGFLSGFVGGGLGRGLDVVIDTDGDGNLSFGDWIDGGAAEPGLWLLYPTALQGPYLVTEVLYSGGNFLGQDLYYPSNIASLGELPLVVVSHGNGHNYQWYDHIGFHLASYGYVVMSHQNNTVPGVVQASTTTLTNTNYLLGNLTTIAGGALLGHLDRHRIAWIGHSRGGEGVAIAYDRLFDGTYTPTNFSISDIVFVSSIAPTDFQGTNVANPHGVPYHLWTGGADSDVNGCADCNLCQTFHLHERATGPRSSISLHGAGHGAFHNSNSGGLFAAGPCQLTRGDVNLLMKTYLLPLMEWYVKGNPAGRECLWRQWESFHSPGAPSSPCVVIDLMHREPAAGRLVIDDFETNADLALSSSGGSVTYDVDNAAAGLLDDATTSFTTSAADPMNGMTFSGSASDTTRGMVFDWNGVDRQIAFALVPGLSNTTAWDHLSLRACQATRHPLTTAVLGDLDFTVRLRDAQGASASIRISAYGGGIEEPYQRTDCGTGAGWANEWETVRIPLADFARVAGSLDRTQIVGVDLLFGPSHGSAQGRLGLDDLEFVRD